MPNLLRKLIQSTSSSRRRQTTPPGSHHLPLAQRPRGHRYDTEELADLAQRVLANIDSRHTSETRAHDTAPDDSKTAYLAKQVAECIQTRGRDKAGRLKRKGKEKAKRSEVRVVDEAVMTAPGAVSGSAARWVGDDGQKALTTITESLGELSTTVELCPLSESADGDRRRASSAKGRSHRGLVGNLAAPLHTASRGTARRDQRCDGIHGEGEISCLK